MFRAIAFAATLSYASFASASDCHLIDRIGEEVVTPEGIGTLVTCEPLVVRYEDGTEKPATDALPVMRPIPLNAPAWYAIKLDPNWIPPQEK